jgi:hypothetical protein
MEHVQSMWMQRVEGREACGQAEIGGQEQGQTEEVMQSSADRSADAWLRRTESFVARGGSVCGLFLFRQSPPSLRDP